MTDEIAQHSDIEFRTATLIDGQPIDTALISNAEYIIATKRGELMVCKTLGNGITKDGNDLVTRLDNTDVYFSGKGKFEHQFVIYDNQGNKLEPVFKRALTITPVFTKEPS